MCPFIEESLQWFIWQANEIVSIFCTTTLLTRCCKIDQRQIPKRLPRHTFAFLIGISRAYAAITALSSVFLLLTYSDQEDIKTAETELPHRNPVNNISLHMWHSQDDPTKRLARSDKISSWVWSHHSGLAEYMTRHLMLLHIWSIYSIRNPMPGRENPRSLFYGQLCPFPGQAGPRLRLQPWSGQHLPPAWSEILGLSPKLSPQRWTIPP